MLHTRLIMKGTETTDHLNRLKKNQQNLTSTHENTLKKTKNWRECPQPDKRHLQKSYGQHHA